MKKIFKITQLFVLVAGTSTSAFAQMTLSGEIRPRFEYRHGYSAPADTLQKSAQFIQQRTRLNFGYAAEKYKVGVTLQDVRVWGNQSQMNTYDVNTFGLHEGWAEYFFNKKISMRLGRQEISYDDQRMMGAVDWKQEGRAHDAFIMKFTDSTFSAHMGFAYNQNGVALSSTNYSIANSYKQMQYLWLNKHINAFNISVLALNVGQQSPVTSKSSRYLTTIGTRVEYKTNPFFAGLNFYYQAGDDVTLNSTNQPKKISALLGGIDVAYTIKEKFTIGLGYEYISGQSQTDTATAYKNINHSFNPVFGTNHKFNGYMDYYYAGNQFSNVGLQDIILRLKYKAEKWNCAFDIHQFLTAAEVLDTKNLVKTGKYAAMTSNLGTELDLTFSYMLTGAVGITAGYSHYLTSETLGIVKNVKTWNGDGRTDQTSNWCYIMISFKPVFFK